MGAHRIPSGTELGKLRSLIANQAPGMSARRSGCPRLSAGAHSFGPSGYAAQQPHLAPASVQRLRASGAPGTMLWQPPSDQGAHNLLVELSWSLGRSFDLLTLVSPDVTG